MLPHQGATAARREFEWPSRERGRTLASTRMWRPAASSSNTASRCARRMQRLAIAKMSALQPSARDVDVWGEDQKMAAVHANESWHNPQRGTTSVLHACGYTWARASLQAVLTRACFSGAVSV
jgi:hypothetical protein